MKDHAHRSFGEQARHYFMRSHAKQPDAVIDSPAAWLGKDMRERESVWHVRLDDDELATLEILTEKMSAAAVDPKLKARIAELEEQLRASETAQQ